MNQQQAPNPVELFARAARRAEAIMLCVSPSQLDSPTPCDEWNVQNLIDHMVGGTDYLLAAIAGVPPSGPRSGMTGADYHTGVESVLAGLSEPDVLDRVCESPLGFEWSVVQAVAGTFMDHLIHSWDLAKATNQESDLERELVSACSAMFLPAMPEMGRAGGLIGSAVEISSDASPQDQLLAAMGRKP